MPFHSPPAATVPPLTLRMAAGQSLWACLAPGSRLHATQGTVAMRVAPRVQGQVLHSPPVALLRAGDHMVWMEHRQATWVQLGCATHGPAEVVIVEDLSAPGLAATAWNLLRGAVAARAPARTNAAPAGLPTAQ
ncbi:hypothetical protein AcdelDRAFT_2550 [Acidovorax delafieldii 2AN]|uniref:Uncharacterized protein n=1 Tax=Acidovorax delafieldii 2AN TaxID=573060 RepID=C5T6M0_ACIDE|nr:hypothetical protein [Acidovorax delafieldii]EER59880.1 hypothetical protein AcdelDRAFT_2550 [Acidovorax delafieldii 2AN]